MTNKRTVTIGVDGNEANVSEKVGVSMYTMELLKYFAEVANEHTRFIVYLKEHPRWDLPHQTEYFKYKVVYGPFLWSQVFLPIHLYATQNIDVFFSPAHYTPRFCPAPMVVTIHDLAYIYFPSEFLNKDLFKLNNWTKRSINKSQYILTVSEATRQDLIKNFPHAKSKSLTIHNGFMTHKNGDDAQSIDKNVKKYVETHPKYFLFVGTIQPRKNIELLIDAFADFHEDHPQYKLIIAGKKGWLYNHIYKRVHLLDLQDDIQFVGYMNDETIGFLYRHAFAFVLPSLYEGFGIPLLEAMSHDCPVISSNVSSLPEVGGNACLFFDPNNKYELLKKMDELITDTQLRRSLIEKGRERVKAFSWKQCAEKTLQIILKGIEH